MVVQKKPRIVSLDTNIFDKANYVYKEYYISAKLVSKKNNYRMFIGGYKVSVIKTTGVSNSINKRKKPDCDRTIITDSAQLPLQEKIDHKFCKIVNFRNSTSNKYAICIGLNPKWGRDKQFDRSNQKIADHLKSAGYSGFVLVNMFSIITEDMNGLRAYNNSHNSDIYNDMRDYIAVLLSYIKEDIFLFYGEQAYKYVKGNISNALINRYNNGGNIYVSVDNYGRFVHVSNQSCGSRMVANFVAYNPNIKNVF